MKCEFCQQEARIFKDKYHFNDVCFKHHDFANVFQTITVKTILSFMPDIATKEALDEYYYDNCNKYFFLKKYFEIYESRSL